MTGCPWIIPAYAGSTVSTRARIVLAQDHPRIRGEHQWAGWGPGSEVGSSPHTRGAPARTCDVLPLAGIIPAYAGSTIRGMSVKELKADHPRIRGEHRF